MWRKYWLKDRRDFVRLKAEGRVQHHAWMVVSYAPNTLNHNRYGFITGKRIGIAVVRNRIRRLLKETVRYLHEQLLVGYDIIIIARPNLVGKPLIDVVRHTHKVFEQADLVNKEV